MLIRFLVLLAAANLAWFFWTHGWNSGSPQNEPERLAQQMHPEAVQVQEAPPQDDDKGSADAPPAAEPLPPAVIVTRPAPEAPAEGSSAPVIPPVIVTTPTEETEAPKPEPEAKPRNVCLYAGAFNERQIEALRQRAAALPQGSWSVQEVTLPDRWMVFVSAPDELALLARRAELRAQGIDTDRPDSAHGLGLSLGRYNSEERAREGLRQMTAKGVRDARVVTERQSARAWTLRLPSVSPELRERAQRTLAPVLAGHELLECNTSN